MDQNNQNPYDTTEQNVNQLPQGNYYSGGQNLPPYPRPMNDQTQSTPADHGEQMDYSNIGWNQTEGNYLARYEETPEQRANAAREERRADRFHRRIAREALDPGLQHTKEYISGQQQYQGESPGQLATPPSSYLHSSATASAAGSNGNSGAGSSRHHAASSGAVNVAAQPTYQQGTEDPGLAESGAMVLYQPAYQPGAEGDPAHAESGAMVVHAGQLTHQLEIEDPGTSRRAQAASRTRRGHRDSHSRQQGSSSQGHHQSAPSRRHHHRKHSHDDTCCTIL